MKQLILILASAMPPFTATAGLITGTLKGADGSLVTSGVVTASRQHETSAHRFGSSSARSAILPDGTFVISPLLDGVYLLCVQATGGNWLSSCEWGDIGTSVSLTPAQPSAAVSIVLAKGAAIQVRINDVAQLLAAHEGKTTGAHLLVGVTMDRYVFRPALIVARDGGGRTYQVLVPFDRLVNLSVASSFFQIGNALGATIPKFGNLIPVSVPLGQKPPLLVLNVTGAARP
jgi:hypothetical protein